MTDSSLPILTDKDGDTKAGNYFVSNYPPFSQWTTDHRATALERLEQPGDPARPLGLYVHIPFCRKRCHFCYFKVYTGKNSDDIRSYMDSVIAEFRALAEKPFVAGRKLNFVYFGGGTPSFLSQDQLKYLTDELKAAIDWNDVEEVAFECEPGTLNPKKLHAIRELGVTRLSLGIENFDDEILELNNRAHRSKQVFGAFEAAREAGYPHINIDLIAGMLGETDENWRRCVEQTIALQPDAITIYQMEIPYNTTIYRDMQESGRETAPVADWQTKRRWVTEAYEQLEAAGYTVTSAYTAVRDPGKIKFVYRDRLWEGADMLAIGVSSFGHLGKPLDQPDARPIHFQNQADITTYESNVANNESPIYRALPLTDHEAFIREWVLNLKLGHVNRTYFIQKFGRDPFEEWNTILTEYEQAKLLTRKGDELTLTRDALLQVDRLLHAFFLEQHRDIRYT